MLEDFKLEDPEKIHNSNISRLIESYTELREQEIRELYGQNRIRLETNATIKDHIPFFTYQETEKTLMEKYGKPIKISKDKKPDSSKPYESEKATQSPQKRKGLLRFIFR
ncbi:MAG: hypothetical protein WC979_06295 [Candidatus Pacearchaeota archaeon]|jgi:hypothetical protein